jgi:arsenate reductase
VEDPAHATGTDEEIDAAFMTAYRILRKRIETFFALPLEEIKHDRARMKAELDRIGEVV